MKKSHESSEDYLETILILREQNGNVRSIDIVNKMNYSKPSISIAMKHLREDGYVEMDKDNLITLTESGEASARNIYDRHKTLTHCLLLVGVDEEHAREDACKMEHDISQVSYEALVRFLKDRGI